MEKNDKSEEICRSVFKSGGNTTSKSLLTKKWIELINRLERSKSINFREKS